MSTELDRGTTAPSNRADLVPPLVVDGVTKRFRVRGRHKSVLTAVDNVSFTIDPGSALGLVGASGSGKTTLASMITGAIRPTSGSITFGEFEVQTLHSRA